MNTNSILGVHVQAIRLRAERAKILAQNMANADTPGYQARDIDFQDLIAKESSGGVGLRTTNSAHIATSDTSTSATDLKYRIPLQPSVDGNTVDMQTERAEFMRNALMYQTSLQFLNGRINGLMTAIRGE